MTPRRSAMEAHAAAGGVEAGFAAIYTEHVDRLVRLAYLLTGDHHAAEDIVADAVAGVWRRWQRGGVEDVGAYLRTAVVNGTRSRFRRVLRERAGASRRDGDRRGVLLHDERAAERDAVWQAVQRLPRRQREVVVLRFWEDLDVAGTAALLGVSQGTVTTHTTRATDRLAELLEDER